MHSKTTTDTTETWDGFNPPDSWEPWKGAPFVEQLIDDMGNEHFFAMNDAGDLFIWGPSGDEPFWCPAEHVQDHITIMQRLMGRHGGNR